MDTIKLIQNLEDELHKGAVLANIGKQRMYQDQTVSEIKG